VTISFVAEDETKFSPARITQRRNEMPRSLLIVITTKVADGALRDLVRSRGGDDAEIFVVAPASEISRLDWLTNAEDDARGEAASLAQTAAEATPTKNVEGQRGRLRPCESDRGRPTDIHC
jgi:hypothetical protein